MCVIYRLGICILSITVSFEDVFKTVFRSKLDTYALDKICDNIFQDIHNWYTEEDYEDGKLIYFPLPLHEVYLSDPVRRDGD